MAWFGFVEFQLVGPCKIDVLEPTYSGPCFLWMFGDQPLHIDLSWHNNHLLPPLAVEIPVNMDLFHHHECSRIVSFFKPLEVSGNVGLPFEIGAGLPEHGAF